MTFVPIKCVLFDLDGTLADTAPDLSGALNYLRTRRGLDELPLSALRQHCSGGARALLREGFGILPEDPSFEVMRQEFLDYYAISFTQRSRLFDGVWQLLLDLEKQGYRWGVVTNKAERFALPLCEYLNLSSRASCIVSGDTTPHLKPHPASLYYAIEHCKVPLHACCYVGDDARDIAAGQAAGIRTIAIGWGYGRELERWGATRVVAQPSDILAIVSDPQFTAILATPRA